MRKQLQNSVAETVASFLLSDFFSYALLVTTLPFQRKVVFGVVMRERTQHDKEKCSYD
jgi:hypothetical protein